MTVEQLLKEAGSRRGADLGRAIFAQAREELAHGVDRDQIIAALTDLYDRLGREGRDEDQDAIADVLDSLTGFCPPTAAL